MSLEKLCRNSYMAKKKSVYFKLGNKENIGMNLRMIISLGSEREGRENAVRLSLCPMSINIIPVKFVQFPGLACLEELTARILACNQFFKKCKREQLLPKQQLRQAGRSSS